MHLRQAFVIAMSFINLDDFFTQKVRERVYVKFLSQISNFSTFLLTLNTAKSLFEENDYG